MAAVMLLRQNHSMSSTPDATAAIEGIHAALRRFAEAVLLQESTPAADKVLDDWVKCFGGYLHAMERVVLPALTKAGWVDIDDHVRAVHLSAQAALAELLSSSPGSPGYSALLALVMSSLEQLRDIDTGQVIPALGAVLSPGERRLLGAEMDQYLDQPRGAAETAP
jgi:hypothetical protein